MRRHSFAIIVLLVISAALLGCRTRRDQSQPRSVPPLSGTSAPPAASVPTPDSEFPDRTAGVRTTDVNERAQLARANGQIRDAFFAFDSSGLDTSAQEALRRSAEYLRQNREFRVRVEGHCDERGTEQYNLALGERRAATAADYLAVLGVSRDRISTVSYGEERPFETGSSESAWAQNRRAHLQLER